MADHTVRAYDAELNELDALVVQMSDAVIGQLRALVGVQTSRDAAGAQRIIETDVKVDGLQARIEEKVVQVIAKRQPMAIDLRTLIAILKIATDIERIGDLTKNNAKRVLSMSARPHQAGIATNLERLGHLVQEQVVGAVHAFIARDVEKARGIWSRDSEVDNLQTSLLRELLTYMMEDPRNIGPCTHLIFCARNLERIGDHATNIAEQIHYIITGTPMPVDRPRGASASELPA